MKSVHIRNIEIGAGMPKICVPITGKTNSEILTQVKEAVQHQPDLLEWRADFYVDLFDYNKVEALAEQMRVIMREIPLLFTVRTANEGGQCTIAPDKYRELLLKVSGVKEIDLFDVELLMDESMELLIQELQGNGKIVIASNHHFHRTPSKEDMQQILEKMEESGADIRKLAVMPEKPEDVLALLGATVLANQTGEQPVITMSMSGLGAVSRVCGQVFGSAVTFGTVGAASAPGQLELSDLKLFLEKLQV